MPEGSTIAFDSIEQLCSFVVAYEQSGATSLFDVKKVNGKWRLTFNGAY